MVEDCRKKEKRIAVIGLGLLGGSFGLALKNKGFFRIGWARRPEIREAALAAGAVDETADTAENAVSRADITVSAPVPW